MITAKKSFDVVTQDEIMIIIMHGSSEHSKYKTFHRIC